MGRERLRKNKTATEARKRWYKTQRFNAIKIEQGICRMAYAPLMTSKLSRYRAAKDCRDKQNEFVRISTLYASHQCPMDMVSAAAAELQKARRNEQLSRTIDEILGNLNASAIKLAANGATFVNGMLIFETGEIELRDSSGRDKGVYPVGRFYAQIHPRLAHSEWDYSLALVEEYQPYFACGRIHPHVNGGEFCFGKENHLFANRLIMNGRIADLAALYSDVIASYNRDTAYFDAARYAPEGVARRYICDGCHQEMEQACAECVRCGKIFCWNCYNDCLINACQACGEYFCEDCDNHYIDECCECGHEIHECSDEHVYYNGGYYHVDCMVMCESCQADVPKSDARVCEQCGDAVCEECAFVCQTCHKTYCENHSTHCQVCDDVVCFECAEACRDCGVDICRHCGIVKNGDMYCPTCCDNDTHRVPDVSGQLTLFEKDEA